MRRWLKQVRSVEVEWQGMGKCSCWKEQKCRRGIVIESRQEGCGNFRRGLQSEHVFKIFTTATLSIMFLAW